MAELYFENSHQKKQLTPKKETIDYLLNYSKALVILKTKDKTFEILKN